MTQKEILCTLGPSSLNDGVTARLEELGVRLFRLNLSHTKVEDLAEIIEYAKTALPEKENEDHQKSAQTNKAHLFGYEQVDIGHANVQTGLRCADKPDADPRVAADQNQRIFVLTQAHQGSQILELEALDKVLDIILGLGQE